MTCPLMLCGAMANNNAVVDISCRQEKCAWWDASVGKCAIMAIADRLIKVAPWFGPK